MPSITSTLRSFRSIASTIRINLGGSAINDKLVIFESDDWGAIRTPSRNFVDFFKKKGVRFENSVYHRDSLASKSDLENLFDLLLKYKGTDGSAVKLTANCIVANPDFEKIRERDYREYFYEPVYKTFRRYPEHADNLEIWKRGLSEGVFIPQFHGREHININRWLKKLRMGNKKTLESFNYGSTFSGEGDYSFMEAFDWDQPEDVKFHREIIMDGLQLFKSLFGFESKSFIAPCYIWDPQVETALAQNNIKWIQGGKAQKVPTGEFDRYRIIRHFFGKKNELGIRYNIRNVFFEPSFNKNRDLVSDALNRIRVSFYQGRPAVIVTHRVNYIGFIEPENRDHGLRELERLIRAIIKNWPDAKFISTDQLDDFI